MERVILNKIESIERCVKRIDETYDPEKFEDFLYQDALTLNIQRACQQSIDLAMYLVSKLGLGIPKKSSEAFVKLVENKIISKEIGSIMIKMVGFRNIIIHEYQSVDSEIVRYIASKGKDDFLRYSREIMGYLSGENK